MIEERIINGVKVGYDTERHSFCNLPKSSATQKADATEKPLEKLTTKELEAKAAVLGIDISAAANNAQRKELIQAYLDAQNGENENEDEDNTDEEE